MLMIKLIIFHHYSLKLLNQSKLDLEDEVIVRFSILLVFIVETLLQDTKIEYTDVLQLV